MMLTTKGRYAVMAVLELASKAHPFPVTLAEISKKQNIPLNYLEQIFLKLKSANIVRSVKGPKGGYFINTELANIRISDVIDAVNENIVMTRCFGVESNSCLPNKVKCNAHHLWLGLGDHIRNYFASISVADMVGKVE